MAGLNNFSFSDANPSTTPREVLVPEGVVTNDNLSQAKTAPECFIHQKFSGNLQAYLIGYVNQVNSIYSIFGG